MDDRQAAFLATIEELERIHGYKIDAILPDGTHRYFSTHCRHGDHEACSATELRGDHALVPEGLVAPTAIRRKPAQCKHCGEKSPCVCLCHKSGTEG